MYVIQILVFLFLFVSSTICQSDKNRTETAIPVYYNLSILTELGPTGRRFEGSVEINLTIINEGRRYLTLHAKNLTIDTKIHLFRHQSRRRISVNSTSWDIQNDKFTIKFNNVLRKHEMYTLSLNFSARLTKKQNNGYFRVKYLENDVNHWYAVTQMEPTNARTVFPCFDDVYYKANFSLMLGHHKNYTAVSNMPVKEKKRHVKRTDFFWTVFEESLPLSIHMLSWSLHELQSSPRSENDIDIQMFALGDIREQIAFLPVSSMGLLMTCEKLAGMPYPRNNITKIDRLVLPNYLGPPRANWGLYISGENILPQEEGTATTEQQLTELVARQLILQWHGNLAGIDNWQQLWLRDGLVHFLGHEMISEVMPEWELLKWRLLNDHMEVLQWDGLIQTRPIDAPQLEPPTAKQTWHMSQKMCCLMHMLMSAIGTTPFRYGLRNYWKTFANRVGNAEEFLRILQKSAKRSHAMPMALTVELVMNSWLQQPGYPLVQVYSNEDNKTVSLTQRPYRMLQSQDKNGSCWWIPISFTTKKDLNFNSTTATEWLGCEVDTVNLEDVGESNDWIILNLHSTQLYRVLYDVRNWELISEHLTSQHYNEIPVPNRAKLVDDALNFAWIGELSYEIALGLVRYLQQESSYIVWRTFLVEINRIHSIMHLTTGYRIFRSYMRYILEPQFQDYVDPTTLSEESAVKAVIYNLACTYEVPECVHEARKRFHEMSETEIPLAVREVVYCTVVRHGMESKWLQLRDMIKSLGTEQELRLLLNGMACSPENWALGKLLRWTLKKRMMQQETALSLYKAVLKNPNGYGLAKYHLINNMDAIRRLYGPEGLLDFFQALSSYIATPEELQFFRGFLKVHKLSTIKDSALLEQAESNVQWSVYRYYPLLNAIRHVMMNVQQTEVPPTKP
ncbi:thyrotropin-releasing hormone-degrading ectoenzyme-like [Scaptodrosophila lebanonensis]|uniref:Thyrotropin-releasing hormone-degrading ectoenzyme-like n=1 Tax=Drosophila lebanonensis TaxID=7225 RepID=A0A6J2TRV1_DROLE|nr:thyrotropin-releasing hormone-degrading ectoenzyme-like [Scaptodrosophila lebanonensis]